MKINKILFIHPSRGRPVMGVLSAEAAISSMRTGIPFRYVWSLDFDDPCREEYMGRIRAMSFKCGCLCDWNESTIPAVNKAAANLREEDLIINIADDFGYTPGWDEKMVKLLEPVTRPEWMLHLRNMDNGQDLPIVQIVSAAMYRRLNYFFYPEYISMFADNDLLELARQQGWVVPYDGPEVLFIHNHPNWGRGQWDETYARENTPVAYQQGQALLAQRRGQRFGL